MTRTAHRFIASGVALALTATAVATAYARQDPDSRATEIVAKMNLAEKIHTVFGYFATDYQGTARPLESIPYTAGFVYGVPRLGLPNQFQTDAGMGVATQQGPAPRARTALPSGLAVAASWNPQLAYEGGAMIGKEARQSGHNVLLAGGVNLLREPRNGRNFEYAGEDPLLAGVMVGEAVRGIQSNSIISTVKHFALNDQETGRFNVDAQLGDAAARTSDLLAFQFAVERGDPGAIMCAYNRVNGAYACESDYLLNQVLKRDWHYPGFVMSDWGATHSTVEAAEAGLDQESGWPFDKSAYFNGALQEAVENGHLPQARLDDMVHRIVRSLAAHGVLDHPVPAAPGEVIDYGADGKISQAAAEEAIVLLKNEGGLLPLAPGLRRIAIIGGHADKGVLSGGGSSQVYPQGGMAVPNEGSETFPGPIVYDPSSPLRELRQINSAQFQYDDGKEVAAAARLAARSDVAIVFATQWMAESQDAATLSLPGVQDELIAAVVAANPHTVVVLETGGPVAMPWLRQVPAVVEAWYAGTRGGAAIARVLSGSVNPSGHLPASFPRTVDQLPRPTLDAEPAGGARITTNYNIEGAAVGYKWFQLKGLQPLFAFGHGLSYTTFDFGVPQVQQQDGKLRVHVVVRNTGRRTGAAVVQLYASPKAGGWEAPQRLVGWHKLSLRPGEERTAAIEIDPRLLSVFEDGAWSIKPGDYTLTAARASDAPVASTSVWMDGRRLDLQGH